MEVLVSVAVTGLVVTAGFRLIAMSYKLLAEVRLERELTSAMNEVWLRFRTEGDMAMSGKEKEYSWEAEKESVPVGDYEFRYRRVTVTTEGGRSGVIYVPE